MTIMRRSLGQLKRSIFTTAEKKRDDAKAIVLKRESKLPRFPQRLVSLINQLSKSSNVEAGFQILVDIQELLAPPLFDFSENEQHRCREALLSLWGYLLSVIDDLVDPVHKRACRTVVLTVMERNEFAGQDHFISEGQLGSGMSAGSQSSSDTVDGTESSMDPKLMAHLARYRKFLVATFDYAAAKLAEFENRLVLPNTAELEFYSQILAIVFVRIPPIQKCMVAKFEEIVYGRQWFFPDGVEDSSEENGNSPEKKASGDDGQVQAASFDLLVQYVCGERTMRDRKDARSSTSSISSSTECGVFSFWQQFSPYLKDRDDTDLATGQQTEWLNRLCCDAEFFYSFAAHLSEYVRRRGITGSRWMTSYPCNTPIKIAMMMTKECAFRQWFDILNKEELPQSCLLMADEMSKATFLKVTPRAIKSVLRQSRALIVGADILNVLCLGVLEITNCMSAQSVGFTLTQFEKWFTTAVLTISESRTVLPPGFEGRILTFGLKAMLRSEHFEILKKVLLFLFRTMDMYDGRLREQVVGLLVNQHYRLFLHWNSEVRNYYHHILVYKIVRSNRLKLASFTDRLLTTEEDMDIGPEGPASEDIRGKGPGTEGEGEEKLAVDQSLWSKVDALIAMICWNERANVQVNQRRQQFEVDAAINRSVAFAKLHTEIVTSNPSFELASEGCPGATAQSAPSEATQPPRPPLHLRFLPPEEQSLMEDLCGQAAERHMYLQSLQIYAQISLQAYSELLTGYYAEASKLDINKAVVPPALGFN